MERKKIKGLVAATVTPMKENGELNLQAINAYAKFLINRGVKGAFVCGTTGEGMLLDNEERKREAEAWMPYADQLKILVHVGSTSYKISQDLASHAEKIGAHAISAMGPCFLQPKRAEELVGFNQKIAEAAPNTPYYYYNIPVTSGVSVDMIDFLKLSKTMIPTLMGIKYTSYNTMEEQEIIALDNGYFDILHGHDELLFSGMMLGAKGGIGTSYNLTSLLYNEMMECIENGDIEQARSLQEKALPFIHLMCNNVNAIAGIKAMLNVYGIECGPCRLPLRNLTKEDMKKLENDMKEYSWI